MSQQPLLFGHRGASARAPENTLAAFALAIAGGADGIECDVHLTADEHLVILHDDTVDATTDGHGPITALTLAEVRQLSVHARHGVATTPVEGIPTLDEVLDRFGPDGVLLNVEIKATASTKLAERVARLVAGHPARDRILLSSFDQRALAYLHQYHTELRRALLYPPSPTAGIFAGLLGSTTWLAMAQRLGCEAVHPFWRLVTRRVVQHAHRLGLKVNVWTVDDGATARKLALLEVDGIITNDPQRLRAEMYP